MHASSYCFERFWWRILLSCRLTREDLNSVQLNICFKDGVLRRLHGRISCFWMCSDRFRRIVVVSKSDVGDVSTMMTPGVALQRRKPWRKYSSSLHLTTWTYHAEPRTCFILAVYGMRTSSAVLLKSPRLRGIFRKDSCLFCHRFELCSRVNCFRHCHISKIHRVSCILAGPGNVQGACIRCFLPAAR